MSEQRFELMDNYYMRVINDENYVKGDGGEYTIETVVDKLNEQQATITYLEEANPRLQKQLGKTLRLVDEQQATINRLQEQLNKILEEEYGVMEDEL